MQKLILLFIGLVMFTGCSEISSNKCKDLGYTYAIENGFGFRLGCAKIEKDMVIIHNMIRNEKYTRHIEDSGPLFLLD